MERTIYKIIFLIIMFVGTGMISENKIGVYNAYVSNRMQEWKSIIDRMYENGKEDEATLLELINFQYGYIGWCIGKKRNDEAKNYLQKAESVLEKLSVNNKNNSIVNSYKAAFYGYRMGMNKTLAPILGIKSIDCATRALKDDPGNYFAYIQNGNIEFYMPAVLGGSKKKALDYYLTAEKLIENNRDTVNNWNYLSLLTVISQSYYYLNDFSSSMKYIDKMLRIEPEFGYAKNELYPMVLNKLRK
jgi:tetratricopeptide (TPR) repeat protein